MTQRNPDHGHPDLWPRAEQYRFEDRMSAELKRLNENLSTLTSRITLIMGGLALLAFALPIVIPLIRTMLNIHP